MFYSVGMFDAGVVVIRRILFLLDRLHFFGGLGPTSISIGSTENNREFYKFTTRFYTVVMNIPIHIFTCLQ